MILLFVLGCSVNGDAQQAVNQPPPLVAWHPEQRPTAVIIGLHGLNDYHQTFAAPAGFFANHGFAVYAYDQRGFGDSPPRGRWAGEEVLIQDLTVAIRQVAELHPERPIYLLGHSMGAAVILLTLAREPSLPVAGVVLAAPALLSTREVPWLARAFVWLGAELFPWVQVARPAARVRATEDEELVAALSADPGIIRATRLEVVRGVLALMRSAEQRSASLDRPLLLLHGARDEIVPKEVSCRLAKAVTGPVDAVLYPERHHLLLREQGRERVWQDIATWLAWREGGGVVSDIRGEVGTPSDWQRGCEISSG